MATNQKLPKKEFEERLPELRARLLKVQSALREADFRVIVIISGVDGAGKGEVVHRLHEWLDPRGIDTHAFWQVSDEEQERPSYWRFWRVLPARGRIGIFFSSWYTQPLVDRVYGKTTNADLDLALKRIALFERMLASDGAVILKFSLNLSKKDQRQRLRDLEENPRTHWRVLPTDWKHHRLYDRFVRTAGRVMLHTHTPDTPWINVESVDSRFRDFEVARALVEAIERKLEDERNPKTKPKAPGRKSAARYAGSKYLAKVDLSKSLSDRKYRKRLAKYQSKLTRLVWMANEMKVASVIVFEGWDAAGKGSAIRRVTEAMDPRLFRLIPVAAPTDEERSHHYLWRFWRHVPRNGLCTIFDRSWYGRVLVERVEGFASPDEWKRSYEEINDFEQQLAEHGIVLAKFWIHISKEEQLRRFERRQQIPYKRYKITEEDWRNRDQWSSYEAAVNEMVARTSTKFAPWTLVPGNDKRLARVAILKTLCGHLEKAL